MSRNNSSYAMVAQEAPASRADGGGSDEDGGGRWRPKRRAEKSRCRPKLQKRLVLLIGVVLLVSAAAGVVQLSYSLSSSSSSGAGSRSLEPPDPELPQPPSPSVEHRFRTAAVCSDGAPCSAVGKEILEKNGSVVDAAIATMFCNGIVTSQSMGLGGGFLMTLYLRGSQTAETLDARESAPAAATADMFRGRPESSQTGPLAIGVPGELKGYWEAHKRHGRLEWAALVEPTIRICEQGYNMTKHVQDTLEIRAESIFNSSTLRAMFVDPATGKLKRQGSLIRPGKICSTLRAVAERGGDDLYTGALAKTLAEDIASMGGIITEDDLRDYTVQWQEPVKVTLRDGERLFSVPPPGSGVLLAFILNILDGYNFTRDDLGSVAATTTTYQRVIEAFKYAYARRTELGDPRYVNVDDLIRNLTSQEYAALIRKKIQDNATMDDASKYGAVYYNQDDHGTSHISIIAPNGDAVSVTSTVNIYFGAGVASDRTGIILNSGMDDFSVPEFNNYFGLPYSPANAVQPGKRAMSSMSPSVLVDRNGDVRLVIGASGGTKITTATALVIMRYIWFGNTIKEAVDASRIHHQLFPMEVQYEYGVLDGVVKSLAKIGHNMTRYRNRGSIICAIAKQGDAIIANADYRKGGDVFGM
ncbi:scoloptoxin SSD14-like isoform X4 [Bacillus rossius redtenbacheri]|uniref:scoloptoxin SSD14-like isoform X4 n=1 Tax=Bacillus rossius redtenbacheri TaxID=93214 RepID=UPI002FDE86A9